MNCLPSFILSIMANATLSRDPSGMYSKIKTLSVLSCQKPKRLTVFNGKFY